MSRSNQPRGHKSRAGRLRLASLTVICAGFLGVWACNLAGRANTQAGTLSWTNRRRQEQLNCAAVGTSPDEVLCESATTAFEEELPHWLHSAMAKALKPLAEHLPDFHPAGTSGHASRVRQELLRPTARGNVVFVDELSPSSLYRRWRRLQHETCHVLGFTLPEQLHNQEQTGANLLLCPELWVDEAWPPMTAAPTLHGRAVPLWSVTGYGVGPERGLMVLNGRLLRGFPDLQVKALMGHELGRAAFALLGGHGFGKAWLDRLAKVYLGGQVLQGWQTAMSDGEKQKPVLGIFDAIGSLGHRQRPSMMSSLLGQPQGLLGLFGGQSPVGLLGLRHRRNRGFVSDDGEGSMAIPGLSSGGLARPLAEWMALDLVVRRTVPWMLRPVVYAVVLAKGGPESLLGPLRRQLNTHSIGGRSLAIAHRRMRPSLLPPAMLLMMPWLRLLVQAGGVRGATALAAACGRSEVITADRAAALAAGDADTAAAALLRVYGQMPIESAKGEELEAVLHEAAECAQQQVWRLRREAFAACHDTPAPEERVRELLTWARSGSGTKLLALAELRRTAFLSGLSWWYWLWPWSADLEGHWWQPLVGRSLLVILLLLPMLVPVDLVRWASMCTLGVTCFGCLAPLLLGGAGLASGASAAVALLLIGYAACAWMVWWNHLLGGSRRWAELSSKLTSQLADQADVTAGIAYLTRDWAEMARRSLAALDQELCGSWRTSLHELASKLTDLRSDLSQVPAVAPTKQETLARSLTTTLASTAVRRGTISRSNTAPTDGSAVALQLWHKVDRAVQRTLQVEAERMKKALETDDPKVLQAMMNWWSANNSAVAGAAAAAVGAGTLWRKGSFDQEDHETLGAALLSEHLHQRFQYHSFSRDDDLKASEEEPPVEQFERLEQALTSNFQSLQELRGRLAPMATAAGTLRCIRRRDLVLAAASLQELMRRCQGLAGHKKGKGEKQSEGSLSDDSPEDTAAERRILGCLSCAALVGLLAAPFAAAAGIWLWATMATSFAAANIVLLLNYQRLSLPHVHRRFERQLCHLSDRREDILAEIRDLQHSSQQAGATHMRAFIFLQSVNVLRNINYVVLCIKTESQRAAAASSGGMAMQQASIVIGGLQLLLALLPRCERRWEAEILADKDCGSALVALGPIQRASVQGAPLQKLVAESQKRLWILLRMVHLSSVLPIEAQGQLASLVERYARPILIEGWVPLRRQSALELAHDGCEVSLYSAAGNGSSRPACRALALGDGNESSASRSSNAGRLTLADQQCTGAAVSEELPSGQREALKQLAATRRDCSRVLARLDPEVRLGPGQRAGKQSALQESEDLLHDLFASILILMAPSGSNSSGSSRSPWSGSALGSRRTAKQNWTVRGPRAAAALGFRYGDEVYTLEGGLQTSILLRVVTLGGQSEPHSGSIGDLRSPSGVGGGNLWRAEEVELPLTAILDEAPNEEDTDALWTALAAARPGWYGENALQERGNALRRVTSAAQRLRRGGRRPSSGCND
eukprot:TRINITY_DN27132_c0_g1_i1.p1 TRINITY_DN27132_c0_g1~~TRINITY_DN27132_c0_g1_i1.p1  ORF type:complete len:1505 (-),score=312.51 TRINITY_DN27132_c0_g1_i1:55-4569(-)